VYAGAPLLAQDGLTRNSENALIAKARGRERHAGKSVLMKFLPTVVCGVLLVLPLTVTSAFAQSSTQSGTQSGTQSSSPTKSTKAQAAPSGGQSATSPSNRNIGSLTPGTPTPPANPITMAQTRELLDLMGYKKIEENNWSQMIAMNKQAAPFIPEDVWTDVQTSISGIDYPTLMQPIYAKYLSTDDAAKALDFYRTPAGKRVLQAMPQMLGESVSAAQQKGRQAGRDAIEKHRPEIEVAQKKYQAEHPPAGSTGPGAAGPGAGGPGAGGPGAGGAAPSPSTQPAPATPQSTTPPPPPTTKPQR
jgi:hypothetical protein